MKKILFTFGLMLSLLVIPMYAFDDSYKIDPTDMTQEEIQEFATQFYDGSIEDSLNVYNGFKTFIIDAYSLVTNAIEVISGWVVTPREYTYELQGANGSLPCRQILDNNRIAYMCSHQMGELKVTENDDLFSQIIAKEVTD